MFQLSKFVALFSEVIGRKDIYELAESKMLLQIHIGTAQKC